MAFKTNPSPTKDKEPTTTSGDAAVDTEVALGAAQTREDLTNIMKSLDPGLSDDPRQLHRGAQGPSGIMASPILMPNAQTLQDAMTAAKGMQGKFMDEYAPEVAASVQSELDSFKSAMSHRQNITTRPTNLATALGAIAIPPDVRDNPNRLYYHIDQYKNYHYVREVADMRLRALFGRDLGLSVMQAAANRGFDQKPLVWVSQELNYQISTDKPHKYDYNTTTPFNAAVDEDASSPFLEAMTTCFNALDVRALTRLARYENQSVLSILRAIFRDVVVSMHITVPPSQMHKWWDE